MTEKSVYVTIARVLRPQGRRGEVAAEILTDFPERLKTLEAVFLWDGRREPHRTAVRGCWLSLARGGQAIFHFAGCDSISEAKKLVGLEVQIRFEDRMRLPPGSYYIADLIGCEVFESDGCLLGRVSEVESTGQEVAGTPILVVDSAKGELLIPLARDICVRIDPPARRIEVALPDGLRELNQP